jgi:hypothetical protein
MKEGIQSPTMLPYGRPRGVVMFKSFPVIVHGPNRGPRDDRAVQTLSAFDQLVHHTMAIFWVYEDLGS